MLGFLAGLLIFPWVLAALIINCSIMCPVLFVFAIFKLMLPIPIWQRAISFLMLKLSEQWIYNNNFIICFFLKTKFTIRGLEDLHYKKSYFVLSNHQTWIDILVLQKIFVGKIPFLRFFLKKQLIWVPFIGLSCKAMDFPFMNRYSRDYLTKHPEKKGEDLKITKAFCKKIASQPVSIMNFAEGTRFTPQKHSEQKSPFKYLLKPKAGGLAFVLEAMGENIHTLLDVTICYPNGSPSFVQFCMNQVPEIRITIKKLEVPTDILGDYFNNETDKKNFQDWVNDLWQSKDNQLDSQQSIPHAIVNTLRPEFHLNVKN